MLVLLILLGCSSASPPPAPEAPKEVVVTHSAAAVKTPSVEAHPGQIVFLDPDGSERSKTPDQVPEGIAWVKVGELWEPVVRVVATGAEGKVRHITSYGVDGQQLERVTASPPPR